MERRYDDEVVASTSTGRRDRNRDRDHDMEFTIILTPEEKAERLIREAENAKAKIFAPQGKGILDKRQNFEFTAKIDEEYSIVGAHVNTATQQKIIKGDYVDFGKLLPRDKIAVEEDSRFELVMRNGRTFWSPVSDSVSINSFSKWEQAFRVYSNIYTREHPRKSTELIQYNHIIHTIAQGYTWNNVYAYDKDFRLHLSKHTEQNWGLILHQPWFLRLKDRINSNETYLSATPSGRGRNDEPCQRFNCGKCNFGVNCKYEHRCTYCGKHGHSFLNCRKAKAEKDRKFRNDDRRDRKEVRKDFGDVSP